mgnify:CR=1 FL=1
MKHNVLDEEFVKVIRSNSTVVRSRDVTSNNFNDVKTFE